MLTDSLARASLLTGLGLSGLAVAAADLAAQATIDSIHIEAGNVFGPQDAKRSWLYRTANSLRFKTREGVVDRELLFRQGEPLDTALLAETERNLRALNLFRDVQVDTVVLDGRVIARVDTRDAWSTLPVVSGSFASDGTLTGVVGLTERNVLGTGNLLSFAYRKETDRDGGDIEGRWRRLGRSQIDAAASLGLRSDGNSFAWVAGDPWRSLEDRRLVRVSGAVADRRRLQYRVVAPDSQVVTSYRQHLLAQQLTIGVAPVATPRRILRLTAVLRLRNERYILTSIDSTLDSPPDSLRADVGMFLSMEHPRFRTVGYVDGLNEQDVDLSTGVTLGLFLAPAALGYERDGVGPSVTLRGGTTAGPILVRAGLAANGLFNSAGLDSGRVVASVTAGALAGTGHSTLAHVQGGLMKDPAPGREFDLGFSVPPRSFEPHAFVGTRSLWGTLEHRWYVLPRLFDQFGAALAGYFDFGGAWYPDESSRWGAEVGVGIRTSSRLASQAKSTRLDLGYRLGSNFSGSRFVFSVGTGFVFF